MKIGIIGHTDHGKTTLTAAISRLKEIGNDIIIIEEDNSKLTKNKPYNGSLSELLRDELDSFKVESLPLLSEIDLGQYKSGRENRRERRKQNRAQAKRNNKNL